MTKHLLWAVPVLVLPVVTGCHRHARVHAGVEYYAPLEPAQESAAVATRAEKDADREVLEAREREADANQRLADAEEARAMAEAERVAAEARAADAAKRKAALDAKARQAERERAEAEARARAAGDGKSPAVVIIVGDSPRSEAPRATPKPAAAPSDKWIDTE